MLNLAARISRSISTGIVFLCASTLAVQAQVGTCSIRSKIVGGEFARITAWPGIAALRLHASSENVSSYFCGGTAIAQDWVLTAGHCLHRFASGTEANFRDHDGKSYNGKLQVIMRNDRLSTVKDQDVYNVDKVVFHPKYLAGLLKARANDDPEEAQRLEDFLPIAKGNDIALLRLSRAFRGRTAPLSLNARTDPADGRRQKVRVAGFGRTENNIYAPPTNKYTLEGRAGYLLAGSNRLKQATLFSVPTGQCSRFYGSTNPRPTIGNQQICAGLEQGGEDSCNGDSGGPLVGYDLEGCPYQIGIVSWGKNACAVGESYSVYTRISAHARWIQDTVGRLPAVSPDRVPTTADKVSLADSLDAINQLKDMFGSFAARVDLSITDDGRKSIRLGEKLVFRATSQITGRLILIDINAKGDVLLIFPNKYVDDDNVGKISAGETISVPSPGYGFTAFQAVEPVGKSRVISLVVPEEFDLSRIAASARIRKKGLVPIKEPTNYLARFIRQIEKYLTGSRNNRQSQRSRWAYSVTEYEIVN